MKLPSEILTFKLIRRANISRVEKMLVLTGMHFDNKDSLFENAKSHSKSLWGISQEGVLVENQVSNFRLRVQRRMRRC